MSTKTKRPGSDQVLNISEVEFDPKNARKRTERSSYAIKKSLEEFGPLRSLVGQRLPDGRIIVRAGNGTLEEAGQIGIENVRVVERKPNELVVVVADDLSEESWKQYAIADNRASDLSEWDVEMLQEIQEEVALDDFFFDGEIEAWEAESKADDFDDAENELKPRQSPEVTCPSCGHVFVKNGKEAG